VPIIGKYVEGGLLIVGGGALCVAGVLELVGTGGGLTPVAGAQCAVGLGAAGYGGAVLVTAGPMQMNSDSSGSGSSGGDPSASVDRSSLKKMSDSFVKKVLEQFGEGPEAFKKGFVGPAGGSFDVYQDTSSGQLILQDKSGGALIETGYNVDGTFMI